MKDATDQAGPPPAVNLFEDYASDAAAFDEMRQAGSNPRPHWRDFIQSLERLGRHELASRWENGRRLIREHGVTYNVYGDPQGMDRPWGLDLVPLLVTAEEWQRIETGLLQRSLLFNLILSDLYGGAQRLLRDGFLPPELVYANPGFLRPCRGILPPHHTYLHLHACDLGRSADGQWWVLADRTQAPSGAGYALENRNVISRVLPDEMRDCNVKRLAGFFRMVRNLLLHLAPAASNQAQVVLLTPGPHNETYFEHAYLARHLGFPLVEGADLTVRGQRVFLKTLEGLQPVDVILRRVDDSFCDPLELRSDSFLGVPGLVQATRSGNVAVANSLGSGLMESPAFLAFLPSVCRHLLDEDLLIPSVATWWCGQAEEMRYVLEHLDQLVVKPAFGRSVRPPWFGGRLTNSERTKLISAIRARPSDFIGQERVVLSRAPIWLENRFEARSVIVRAYAACGRDRQAVLPGGLTRVARTSEDPVVSMQSGGGSKDTWVLSNSAPGRSESVLVSNEERPIRSFITGTASRAADNLFWLGRYTERLEQTLRLLRCVLSRLTDESGADGPTELSAMAELMAGLNLFPGRLQPLAQRHDLQRHVLQLIHKSEIPGSVRELIARIRLIVSTVRDRFSGDTWRILGRLDLDARARPGRLPLTHTLGLIHNLVLNLAAFNGMEMENMTRGHGWRFLDVGRRLERGTSVANLVRAALEVQTRPSFMLEAVLEIADSIMTYRRRHFAEPRLPGFLDLLLRDESNPRSFAFQVRLLREHERELPRDPAEPGPREEQRQIEQLAQAVTQTDLATLAAEWSQGQNQSLRNLLHNWAGTLAGFSDAITHRYFSHTMPRVS